MGTEELVSQLKGLSERLDTLSQQEDISFCGTILGADMEVKVPQEVWNLLPGDITVEALGPSTSLKPFRLYKKIGRKIMAYTYADYKDKPDESFKQAKEAA